MRIRGTRIRSLDGHFRGVTLGTQIVVGLTDVAAHAAKLGQLGFSTTLEPGETVLPGAGCGPVCEYNAEGKEVPDKTKPMETAFRTIEWRWEEFRGRYDRVPRSDFRDISYKRYPKKRFPPPSVELTVRVAHNGDKVLTASPIRYETSNHQLLLHTINVFLELFGECNVLDDKLTSAKLPPTVILNWRVLPPGKYPWSRIKPLVSNLIGKAPAGNRPIITARLESIGSYEPEFVAVGTAGFHGYLVFGFPKRNLFVLESVNLGNATYVFDKDWQSLSKLTKAQILDGNLQKARIVHLVSWFGQIRDLLRK